MAYKGKVDLGCKYPMDRCLNIVMLDDGTHVKIVSQYNAVKTHLLS